MSVKKTYLGVIGGSGLYDLPGLSDVKEVSVQTPFGMPSDSLVTGVLDGRPVAFLPRHGKGHRFLPTEVNYRANVYALKSLGVTHILSVSAVGSLQEKYAPGDVVIPAQILDRTGGARARTFFGEGVVGHVSFADPYCPEFRNITSGALKQLKAKVHSEGTYICVEGPRFSTRSESESFRSAGGGIIGMTAMPEAALVREAEMAYCTMAMVTDYDCWKEHEAAVSVEAVMEVLKKNVELSKNAVKSVLMSLPKESQNSAFQAAKYAVMTAPSLIPPETKRKVGLLWGHYWNDR